MRCSTRATLSLLIDRIALKGKHLEQGPGSVLDLAVGGCHVQKRSGSMGLSCFEGSLFGGWEVRTFKRHARAGTMVVDLLATRDWTNNVDVSLRPKRLCCPRPGSPRPRDLQKAWLLTGKTKRTSEVAGPPGPSPASCSIPSWTPCDFSWLYTAIIKTTQLPGQPQQHKP